MDTPVPLQCNFSWASWAGRVAIRYNVSEIIMPARIGVIIFVRTSTRKPVHRYIPLSCHGKVLPIRSAFPTVNEAESPVPPRTHRAFPTLDLAVSEQILLHTRWGAANQTG